VKTDRAVGDQWLVSNGLKTGDKVIVVGLQGIKPGQAVDAKPIAFEELHQAASDPNSSQTR
jgi:membrane fusion protein (multidrug efflux system)